MADDTTQSTETPPEAPEGRAEPKAHEDAVPFERFQQLNRKAKEAADKHKAAEGQIAALRQQLEERESAGLPELEQMKRRLEQAEKRAEDNERKAGEAESRLARTVKERMVTAAAQSANFADASDASAFLNLDEIDDAKDAERAVKRLASLKPHLLKPEEPRLPGRVLENGRPVEPQKALTGSPTTDADRQWAEEVAPQLKRMLGNWSSTSS